MITFLSTSSFPEFLGAVDLFGVVGGVGCLFSGGFVTFVGAAAACFAGGAASFVRSTAGSLLEQLVLLRLQFALQGMKLQVFLILISEQNA